MSRAAGPGYRGAVAMEPLSPARPSPFVALLVALLMTLANAFEPPTVDDVCHYYYARQVAAHPSQPFEFVADWHQKPIEAWNVMVPPVHSYYWAPAIAWFPDDPVAWRFWFLPVNWLFCWSLLCLLHRYARPHAPWLLALVALGPGVLPGLNNMLEVPMLSLGLSALALHHRAIDRRSLPLALGAGAVLGLAMQTKYSAFAFLGPWVLLGVLQRRPREMLVGLLTAAAVALGIEGLLSLSHGGGSYFANRLEQSTARDWPHVLAGLFLQFGMLGVPTAFLGLFALRAPRWTYWGAGIVYAAGHAAAAFVPGSAEGPYALSVDTVQLSTLAACTWVIAGLVCWQLVAGAVRGLRRGWPDGDDRTGLFLAGWFAAEITATLVISPFPAARRVMTVLLAFTVAAAWLAARRTDASPAFRRAAIVGICLGGIYQAVDHLDGRAAERAAAEAFAYARATDPAAGAWFTGGWAFEFCAPRAGLRPLLLDETSLRAGDFVVVGSIDGTEVPWFHPDPRLETVHVVAIADGVPLSLSFGYYSGRRSIDGQRGPRYQATILRARQDVPAGSLRRR